MQACRVLVVSSVFAGFLAGCSSPTLAPVTDRSQQPAPQVRQEAPSQPAVATPVPSPAASSSGTYTVASGDTLYRIAKNHNVEVNDLMRVNGITDPSKLAVGRVLTIPGAAAAPVAQTVPVPAPAASPAPAAAPAAAPAPAASGVKTIPTTNEALQWPVKGSVAKDFTAETRGIDIAAPAGSPVLAAASGEVLLVTDKIKTYGNLVILRHGDGSFVTTYGQMKSIAVQKNDKVKAGQKIGTVGGADQQAPALHFEVRIDGKPVNPHEYLR